MEGSLQMSACDCCNTADLCIPQGATFSRVIRWKADGALVNLTGYSARAQIRPSASSATTTLSLTTENSRIALGGTAGTITLSISATDSAALTAGRYVYDLELVSAGGIVTRLLQGIVTVSANVTR
jgi:tRNA threonylcarbamoyladenosine modification (KEOPS) complex  Pcc1 subunit